MKLNKGNRIGKRTLGIVTAAAVGLSVGVPVFAAEAVQQNTEAAKTDAAQEESQRVPIFWNPQQKEETAKQKDDKKKTEEEETGYSEENAVKTFDEALKLLKQEQKEKNEALLILCGDAELTKEQKDSLKKQKVESMTLEAWEKLLKEEEEQAKADAETEATVTPTPGTEEAVTPTPGTEETVTPTSGTEEAVTPTPGTEETVTPTPGTEETVTPTPGTEETVTPTPGTEETVTPTPGTEETVTPTPGTEETVTPTPGTEETVTPTPGTDETEEPKETDDSSDEEESVVSKVTNILAGSFAGAKLNISFETDTLSVLSLETAAASAEDEQTAVTAAAQTAENNQEIVTEAENRTEVQAESAGADLLSVSQVRTLLRALPGRDLVGHGTTNRGTTTSSKSSQSSSSSSSGSKASNQKDSVISLPVNTGDTVQMLPFVLSGACAIGAAAVTANKWSLTRRRARDCAGYAAEMEAFRKACRIDDEKPW